MWGSIPFCHHSTSGEVQSSEYEITCLTPLPGYKTERYLQRTPPTRLGLGNDRSDCLRAGAYGTSQWGFLPLLEVRRGV